MTEPENLESLENSEHPSDETLAGLSFPFIGQLKKMEEIIHLVQTIREIDINGNGTADWQDLLNIVETAIQDIKAFKNNLPDMTISSVSTEIHAFFEKMSTAYASASAIVGKDLEEFKKKFPNLIPAEDEKPPQ